ncbi:Solute carrier family 15 (Peptide/histidine transporter), member 3/4 [Heracleum sosnowskyi]|uniref:Solute carrier family 15 (Peptide/histidine transporter), member 3/4 n=1 Tax=Heracleum sosnowskyi TaxID=360622 RepID=A0AAD8GZP8_9APIA|nr:Solute carrier family 15 (Peptide/histidine transporter), member 3/4 [Heracleum sosnowskyi]
MDETPRVISKPQNNDKEAMSSEPNYRGIKAMPYIVGNETFEKLGTIGTSSNFLVYLTSVFHMKTITATNLNNIFQGTCNFGTIIGAFLSDTYFGRYKTLGFASISSFTGMLLLTLTAAVSKLHPPSCGKEVICQGPTRGQMAFLLSSFALLVVGGSGIRPCNLAFGADQFNPNTESGRKGINSFFNWYYFTYTFAVMVSLTIIVYVQSNISWPIGFGIPTLLMFLSCVFFFVGTNIYVIVLPQGSPLLGVVQVVAAAIKKRGLKSPEQPWLSLFDYVPKKCTNSKLSYTDQFRFLDKAAVRTLEDELKMDGSAADPWRLCTIQQVEEVKCLLRLVPIWFAILIYHVAFIQQNNYLVFQALQSDRRLIKSSTFKIPAATYIVFTMLTLTIWIPIYDRIIVPFLRKFTGKEGGITVLQRMGIGIVLSSLSLFVSALIESKRRTWALTRPTLGIEPRKGAISSMSGFWFIPQLIVAGLSEGFFMIGQNELFYKQSPENMKSIATSCLFCASAASSYLSSFLQTMVQRMTEGNGKKGWLAEDLNQGKLDYFYYIIVVLEALNLAYFIMCGKWYKYKTASNDTTSGPEVALEELKSEKPLV